MPARPEQLLRYLRRLVSRPASASDSDATLLERFARDRDEDAFAALVARYSRMVRAVCRRVLRDPGEAEDAAQATWLILARKASTLRRPQSLAAWLHGTARQVAVNARRADTRRREREARSVRAARPAQQSDPLDELSARELLLILDEEVQGLPEVYRLPLLLCALEGHTAERAAAQLGWTPGSVRARLVRGRARLHARLLRRGLELSVALAALEAAKAVAPAGMPAVMGVAVSRAAVAYAVAKPGEVAAAGVSAKVLTLAEGVLEGMAMTKLKVGLVLALTVGVVVAGTGTVAHQVLSTKQSEAKQVAEAEPESREVEPVKPEGGKQAAGTDQYGDRLPDGALARMGSARLRHGGDVYALTFSPDGKVLASGSGGGTICLWDPRTGKQLRQFGNRDVGLYSLAFSRDGKSLVATALGGLAFRTWETTTGKDLNLGLEFRGFKDPSHKNRSLAYAVDSKTVIAARWQGKTISLCKAQGGEVIRQLAGHQGRVTFCAFAPDGRILVSASQDYNVRLWHVETGKEIRSLTLPRRWRGVEMTEGDVSLALSPDNAMLASGLPGEGIQLWEVASGKELRKLNTPESRITALAFSPDGKTLASGSNENTIRLWDVASGMELVKGQKGHQAGLTTAVLSPSGTVLATAGQDSTVRLWNAATGKEIWKLKGKPHQRPIAGQIDATTGQIIPRFLDEPWIRHLTFSPDGKTLAGGGSDGNIYVWEADAGRQVRRLVGHQDEVRCLTFSEDGRTLVSAAGWRDGTIRLWDAATGEESRQIESRQGAVSAVVLSADGQILASMGCDLGRPEEQGTGNTVRFWEVATGKEVQRLSAVFQRLVQEPPPRAGPWQPAPRLLTHTVAFSPDSRTLASLGFDNVIRLWDLATRKEFRRWDRDPSRRLDDPPLHHLSGMSDVERLAFSPDGKTLAVAYGYSVLLYEIATGKVRRQLVGHAGEIRALSYDANGKLLASGSSDCTALTWDVIGTLLPHRRLPAVALSDQELAKLWARLAEANARSAYEAVSVLTAHPSSVAYIGRQLRSAPPLDDRRAAQLLADLDSDRFEEREKAEQELGRWGKPVEPLLRAALVGQASLEVRSRIRRLLETLYKLPLSGDRLRDLRAIEVLEYVGTTEAQYILESLAKGASEAGLTQEAKASLQRLAKRPASNR